PPGLPARGLRRGAVEGDRAARAQAPLVQPVRADDEDGALVPRARIPDGDGLGAAAAEAVALQLPAQVAGLSKADLGRSVMARTVKCVKLGREAEGLDFPPYPGELGKRIY